MTWDAVQAKLADNRQGHKQRGNALCPSLLAGLVWDEQGDRLTPSHSRKGNRRYRYYVSDSLIGNRASPDSMGMRIPAHELEQAVMHGLIRFLRQDADILRLLDERGITDAHPVHAILKRAHALAKQIEDRTPAFMNQADDGKPASAQRSDRACDTLDRRRLPALPEAALIGSTGLIGLLQALIQRIVVGSDQLQISVRVNVLLQDARGRLSGEQRDGLARSSPGRPDAVFTMPHGEASASVMPEGMISVPVPAMAKGMVHNRSDSSLVAGPVGKEQDVYTIILPMKLRRSGLAMRLIVPGQEVHRRPDARLGQLLVKAHDWLDRLTSGKAGSVLAIANEEKITSAYVTRVIGLAFLAPDIVKAILQGQQPETLTSDSLMRSMPLPIDWMEQKELLGFVS